MAAKFDASLPIDAALPALKAALADRNAAVLVAPPGAGKTTALVNSGLKFPLSRGATPAAVAGVGGTRYCDWWFTEDAVLIDTAGRSQRGMPQRDSIQRVSTPDLPRLTSTATTKKARPGTI